MRKRFALPAVLLGLALAAPASAQMKGPLAVKDVSLAMAQELASATLAECTKQGFKVTVAVVDRDGKMKVFLRGDGAGPHASSTARKKAYTALTFKANSAATAERAKNAPALKDIEGVITLAGGVVIKAGNEVIGAVGVSGAPGGDKDEACANAGMKKIEAQLK